MTLVSSDGFEFVILREAACVSGAIRRMLDPKSSFAESVSGRCTFEEITWVDFLSFLSTWLPAVFLKKGLSFGNGVDDES